MFNYSEIMIYFRASVTYCSSTVFNNHIIIIIINSWQKPVSQFRLYLNKSHTGEKPGKGSHCTLCETQYELRKPYKVTMLSAENRLVNKHFVV